MAAQLLAGLEIVQRHGGERAALDRDDALVAIVAALIDGEREVAGAQQRVGRRGRVLVQQDRQHFGVGARIAPQPPGVGAIGQQHVHRTVALGLHAERAAEFERGGQPGGQRQCLPHQSCDRRMVVVPAQQRVGKATEPHQPPAHRTVREEEGYHAARDYHVGHRRASNIEENRRVGHTPG